MAKLPPPLSALKDRELKSPASILHKPVSKDVVIHGRVLDRDKAPVKSAHKRLTNDVAKVAVVDGKLVGSKPPVAPSWSLSRAERGQGSEERKCLCGCDREVTAPALFARGHVRRLYAALGAIERGELDPDEALTPHLVELLGPWVPRGRGHTPTNSLWDNK